MSAQCPLLCQAPRKGAELNAPAESGHCRHAYEPAPQIGFNQAYSCAPFVPPSFDAKLQSKSAGRQEPDAPISRFDGTRALRGRRKARPHRHRHPLDLRPSDALRLAARLPAGHHQEAARQIHHLRVAVVPARRHQRQISQRSRRHDLERMGRRERRSRPGLRQAMALMAGARRRHASTRSPMCVARNPPQSGFAPADRDRLESGRDRRHGAAAVPLPVSVQRRRRRAVVPALSALGRRLSRRAVQHRVLRAADGRGGAGDRAASPAPSSTASATRIFISIISSRRGCS